MIAGAAIIGLIGLGCMALMFIGTLVFGGGILPGVMVAGIDVGGMSEREAAAALEAGFTRLTLTDQERTFTVEPAALGIALDPEQTAANALSAGRRDPIAAVFGQVEAAPAVTIDRNALQAGLEMLAEQINIVPVNAGVRLVNGQAEATPPQNGRALDIAGTIAGLDAQGAAALADGVVDLVMIPVAPTVTDATPLLAQAQVLLANSLEVRVFDPITGDQVFWSATPEEWAGWLTSSGAGASGLSLTVADAGVRGFLQRESAVLDVSRYLDLDQAVSAVQQAVAEGNTTADARVYHRDRQHVVQAGETIVSIAWDYGVPYPYVQAANPGLESLTIGQTITIPSPDNFLLFPVVPDKRVEVSISQQRVRVYENGALIHDWPASTGINDSPTWPGIYQVISHEPNAYAGNWNLWMPNFIGVYRPIPGSEFTNGFHGFPTRGGGQILWENSLGTRVTYGCILLSNQNAQWLYNWAEEGVVVEITR